MIILIIQLSCCLPFRKNPQYWQPGIMKKKKKGQALELEDMGLNSGASHLEHKISEPIFSSLKWDY